jgi:hypothetical protein
MSIGRPGWLPDAEMIHRCARESVSRQRYTYIRAGTHGGCISGAHAGLKRLRDGAELLLEGLATVERAELLA